MTDTDSADDHGQGLWLVRICDRGGVVLGGGTVLGNQHVLTCAHVVSAAAAHPGASATGAPDTEVMVEFPNSSRWPAIPARVEQDGWVEETHNGGGDVALLRLTRRVPAGSGVRLQRMSQPRGRKVRMLGFPRLAESGVFVDAELVDQVGEWVQLNSLSRSLHVRRGFSGSAVIDVADGAAIGMVVAELETFGLSWMISVETIVEYLPAVGRWVAGHRHSPPPPTPQPPGPPGETDPDGYRRAADFLGARSVGGVMTTVTGEPGSPASAAITAAAAGSAPATGRVDLVLDATGRSVVEVTADLADRLGIRPAADWAPRDLARVAPPMSLVVMNVDAAADPSRLVRRLLCPLAKRAVARDIRLLLSFRQAERSAPHRLNLLRARLYEADAFGDLIRRLRARIQLDAPDPLDPSALLATLARLRARGAPLPEIEQLEQTVDEALQAASRLHRRFGEQLATRDELRRLLDVYQQVAVARGLAEHPQLGTLFKQAHRALWSAPGDVGKAERLVGGYLHMVHSVAGNGVP